MTDETKAPEAAEAEVATEVEGVEEEGGHVRYPYDASDSVVDPNANHSTVETTEAE